MIVEEVGVRIYSREYCAELFEQKWREFSSVFPWLLVAGGFSQALGKFHRDGVFVARILGHDNLASVTKTFVLQDRDLGLALLLSPAQTGVSIAPGNGQIKLLKQNSARGKFKDACAVLGFSWDQVAAQLTGLLQKCYDEQLVLCEADQNNADALRAALEDDESVDLKIRFRAPEDAPAAPAAPATPVPALEPAPPPQEKEPAP